MTDAPASTEPEQRAFQAAPDGAQQIFTSLIAIADEMGAVAKLGVGPSTQSSYPFMRVDDVIQKLHYIAIRQRVVINPRVVDRTEHVEIYPRYTMAGDPIKDGKADGIRTRISVAYEVDFISAVDGSTLTSRAYGEAHSNDDKGTRKAETQAFKEVLLRVFSITSGEEDPDGTNPSEADTGALVAQDRGSQARTRATRRRGAKSEEPAAEAAAAPAETSPAVAQQNGSESAAATPAPAAPEEEPAPQPAAATDPVSGTPAEAPAEETPRQRRIRERKEAAAAAEKAAESAPAPAEAKPEPEQVREQKSSAEQREEDWRPSPEDIKAAEEMVHEPGSRSVERPADPQTQKDEHAETVNEMRARITGLSETYPDYTRDVLNALGDQMSEGKPRTRWFSDIGFLKRMEKAVHQGEWPDAVEKPGF